MSAEAILSVSILVIILFSWIAGSYKSGILSFSGQSIFRQDHIKYVVNKDRVGAFIIALLVSLTTGFLFGLAIARDVETALVFGLLVTAFLSYGLAYWVLLKESRKTSE